MNDNDKITMEAAAAVLDPAADINLDLEQIQTWRRDLHQIPETGLNTPNTAAYCKEALADTPFTIMELNDPESDSFVAFLDLGKEETIAFRTDMDALPVEEKTGLPFASKIPGRMHACGHDGHMSLVLGFAHAVKEVLKQDENAFPANILLIFQSGEETPGGAHRITETGLFEKLNVKQVFGTHLWPMFDKGVIATRPLEMMAMASEITITIHGKSAHAARYKEGIDAMEIGAALLLDLYALEQSLDPKDYRLLRFGKMVAGSAMNAVAAKCVIEGTLRSFLDPVTQNLKDGIAALKEKYESQTGCTIEVGYAPGYPAVLNDPALCEALFERHPEIVRMENPELIAEDFSEYQLKAPGIFFYLGTGTGVPLHSDHFNFDEDVVKHTIALYLDLARNPLVRKEQAAI